MSGQSPTQSSRHRTNPPSPTPVRAPVLGNPFAPPPPQGSPSEKFKVNTNIAPSAPNKRKRNASGKKTKKRKSRKPRKSRKIKNKKSKRRTKRR
tara:strand:+ start:909 stop:1190 length:282 start_codon:yes stop_codon:yes gene_type:complete